MNKDIVSKQAFNFTPTTLEEAQKYATIIANSGICPESFRGRPNDVLIVLQMGHELNLKPMQALRSLGAINGMPFAYGDGLLALVKRHAEFEDMQEWFEGDMTKGTLTAYCTIKRRGKDPVTQSFSMEDAKRAGLWSKKGVWQLYPKRMLQHRARNFAARDAFPDALYGLLSQDEALNVADNQAPAVEKPLSKGMRGLEEALGVAEPSDVVDAEYETVEEVRPDIKLDELRGLILETNTSNEAVQKWLGKHNVERLEDLSADIIDKAIDYFKTKGAK